MGHWSGDGRKRELPDSVQAGERVPGTAPSNCHSPCGDSWCCEKKKRQQTDWLRDGNKCRFKMDFLNSISRRCTVELNSQNTTTNTGNVRAIAGGYSWPMYRLAASALRGVYWEATALIPNIILIQYSRFILEFQRNYGSVYDNAWNKWIIIWIYIGEFNGIR